MTKAFIYGYNQFGFLKGKTLSNVCFLNINRYVRFILKAQVDCALHEAFVRTQLMICRCKLMGLFPLKMQPLFPSIWNHFCMFHKYWINLPMTDGTLDIAYRSQNLKLCMPQTYSRLNFWKKFNYGLVGKNVSMVNICECTLIVDFSLFDMIRLVYYFCSHCRGLPDEQ